jgi:hypothetical protein
MTAPDPRGRLAATAAIVGHGRVKPARNKYGVSPKAARTVDGITFASKREMEHYLKLRMLQRSGEITRLELQPRFLLLEKFEKAGVKFRRVEYVADFDITWRDGRRTICDVKGMETAEFKLKRKWFEAKYPELTLEVWK